MRVDDLALRAHADARADRYLAEAEDRTVVTVTHRGLRLALATVLVRIAVWMAPREQITLPTAVATAPEAAR